MTIDLPRSQTPRVSVIVVATSNFDLLCACLRSVARRIKLLYWRLWSASVADVRLPYSPSFGILWSRRY